MENEKLCRTGALLLLLHKKGNGSYSYTSLAKELSCSNWTIIRSVKKLVDNKFLSVKPCFLDRRKRNFVLKVKINED